MPQNFIACDREQPFLLPPDVRDWLAEDHLAWFVIDAVGVMETSRFYAAYREDGHGRAAYEPSMMIALLLYCWSRGVRSSRATERACVEDVACRVIAAHQRPDHATIARFVERHERALAGRGSSRRWCAAGRACGRGHVGVGVRVPRRRRAPRRHALRRRGGHPRGSRARARASRSSAHSRGAPGRMAATASRTSGTS